MVSTRRQQAEAASPMVSLDDTEETIEAAMPDANQDPKSFIDLVGICPIFCLTKKATPEYFQRIITHINEQENPAMVITSSATDPDTLIAELTAAYDSQPFTSKSPNPFLKATIDEIWSFYTSHLRPLTRHSFTEYTALAVDEACFAAEPHQLIMITDTADWNETPGVPVMKVVRSTVDDVLDEFLMIETQVRTVTEMLKKPEMGISLQPPAIVAGGGDASRTYKQEMLAQHEKPPWA